MKTKNHPQRQEANKPKRNVYKQQPGSKPASPRPKARPEPPVHDATPLSS